MSNRTSKKKKKGRKKKRLSCQILIIMINMKHNSRTLRPYFFEIWNLVYMFDILISYIGVALLFLFVVVVVVPPPYLSILVVVLIVVVSSPCCCSIRNPGTLQWVWLGANGRFGGRQGTRRCSGRIRV
jgi:hypothetical protein